MQYLFLLIFLYFLLKDFRKGVVIYAPFKFFFYEGFKLGPTSFDIVLSCVVCAIFLAKRRKIITEKFPWKMSFLILLISGVIFSFYPSLYIGELLRQVFCIYGYGFVFFYCLSDKSTVNTFLKSCTLFAILLAGNGFFQLITDQNLLGNFHDSFYNAEFKDNDLVRFGNFSRVRSFCSHSISYGVECVVFFITFLYMYFVYKKEYFKIYVLCNVLLCNRHYNKWVKNTSFGYCYNGFASYYKNETNIRETKANCYHCNYMFLYAIWFLCHRNDQFYHQSR